MSQIGELEEFNTTTYHVDTFSVSTHISRQTTLYRRFDYQREAASQAALQDKTTTTTKYKLFRSLPAPAKPQNKTVADVRTTLKHHVNCAQLQSQSQARKVLLKKQASESIIDFVAVLKQLSTVCECDAFLNEALRDAFALDVTLKRN